MNLSSKIRVAVVRGGPSYGYDTSLKTGGHILATLREMPETYEPVDIFVSKEGEWHHEGLVHDPHRALQHTDVVWNALHGPYGEDDRVTRMLENLKIPFVGSGSMASALATNKDLAKRLYRKNAFLTPEHEVISEKNFNNDKLIAIFRNYLHPVIVKPVSGAGSWGVRLAHTFHELKQTIKDTLAYSPRVLVEEFIRGDEVSCAVTENAKGKKIYSFLPVGRSELKLKTEENKHIESMARRAHEILGLSHYSSSDFIITPKKKIYILETNSSPVLHEDSLMHHAFRATGWHPRDFVEHVLNLAK